MKIRSVRLQDAKGMMTLGEQLSRETSFMLLDTDETALTSLEQQRMIIERIVGSEDERMFVAQVGVTLVGFAAARRKPWRRVRHTFSVVVGVMRTFWGQGVATDLMSEVEDWTIAVGGSRLELSVVANNKRAIAFYSKLGFEVEGTRRQSMKLAGRMVHELYMAKLLGDR